MPVNEFPAALGDVVEVTIERIGERGDGVAHVGRTPIFVPVVLPGERLRVRLAHRRPPGFEGEVVLRTDEVPRAAPACPHFGHCGGCQLQHLSMPQYAAWLEEQVRAALAHRGVTGFALEPPWITPPRSRRRARLAYRRGRAGVRLGFRARASHEVVDVTQCAVVAPQIAALFPPLRARLGRLDAAWNGGEVQVSLTGSGLDVLMSGKPPLTLGDRERLADFAAAHDLARLCWRDGRSGFEPVVVRRPVIVRCGEFPVELPPGAFLQASAEAEDAIRGAVVDALGPARDIVDFFAGCGALSLPLAAERTVRAYEGDPAMVDALARAARTAGLGGRVQAHCRDLERCPLQARELARADGAIVDPPRAGARAQCQALARSDVRRIAMVSCHPATFARDVRILVDGGYVLRYVWPLAPFLWSAQVEVVGALERRGA